jgi:hypothetical protein
MRRRISWYVALELAKVTAATVSRRASLTG